MLTDIQKRKESTFSKLYTGIVTFINFIRQNIIFSLQKRIKMKNKLLQN